MVTLKGKDAQKELDNKYGAAKATQVKIKEHFASTDPDTNKWDGVLTIKDYTALKEVDFSGNLMDEIYFENCPSLEKITLNNNEFVKIDMSKTILDGSGKPAPNNVTKFYASRNATLNYINLENCKKLEELFINNDGNIETLKGSESFAATLKKIEFENTTGLSFSGTTYLEKLQEVEKASEAILGGNVPTKPDGSVDIDKLKNDLKDKGAESSPIKNEKDKFEKEAKEAKQSLNNIGTEAGLTGNDAADKDKIIAKIKELKQQATQAANNLLTEINNLGLGLTGNDITKEKVLEKIKALINKPACTHTDYDSIKAERDRLKTENNDLKNKNVSREVLVEKDKENFQKWNIQLPANYQQKITAASSANEIEEIRSKLVGEKINELEQSRKNATYLNIGLGVLAAGSLLAIVWLITRENNSSKTEEEELEKTKR